MKENTAYQLSGSSAQDLLQTRGLFTTLTLNPMGFLYCMDTTHENSTVTAGFLPTQTPYSPPYETFRCVVGV